MGRRSINTTKSGKFMNPTDQARKEARKRELKKNKKQRMIVRAAVLKGKDPHQILADLERLDQMEYNVNAPPPLNEKVLKDKRRKLKETWDRMVRLYVKEDQEKYAELKRLESDYENRRNQMIKFFEAVKSTQDVALDDIPLPSLPSESFPDSELVPNEPPSILKKPNVSGIDREPPGLPPGPVPELWELDVDLDEEEDKEKRVHFGEGDKETEISEFLREIENVEKTVGKKDPEPAPVIHGPVAPPIVVLRPPLPLSAPLRPGIILPGTPRPRSMPPPHIRPIPNRINPSRPPIRPIIRKEEKKGAHFVSDKATIEAKPQLRNLSADATRFMPISLRVKRIDKTPKRQIRTEGFDASYYSKAIEEEKEIPTKDDAYEQFMKELKDII